MTNKIYTFDEIKAMLADVAPEYDVERIYLFGSYARGEATEESDLDLYVEKFEFKPFHSIFNFMGRMEELFNKNIDVVSSGAERFAKDSFDRSLFENIRKERLICYERK
ncbi:MAG: nucleotidyltransferase domain-containing protein [Ruminococcus sp.]|jgi:predicted nucleotidyltransferase|nr:nucleotidyltransferase domain-containing protein [Ruminococcus sp.]MBP1537249.1 nucleotidyltransferase domain-containing protein [Ruminococcus sp.]